MKKFLPIITLALIFSLPAFAEDKDKSEKCNKNIKRMEKLDKDGDRLISKKEMLTAHKVRINRLFTSYDENKDGKLSRDELRASRKEMTKNHKKGNKKCGKKDA